MTDPMHPGERSKQLPAFTLIELLVVVAIIALLMSILLPSLQSAREQARAVKCGAELNGVGKSLATYAAEYNDFFPGVNTTGVAIRGVSRRAMMRGDDLPSGPATPVQSYDWMTPLAAMQNRELPLERVERFREIWQLFQCASVQAPAVPYSGAAGRTPDFDAFEEYEWLSSSWLMPGAFGLWGTSDAERVLSRGTGRGSIDVTAVTIAEFNYSYSIQNYRSQLERVGVPSRKIFAADGTRYVDQLGLIDFDPSPIPGHYGAFTTAGGWWSGSTAYGVAGGSQNWDGSSVGDSSPSDGQNLPLTYRHGGRNFGTTAQTNSGRINAMFFDGHVERMTDRATREVHLWYPSGAVIGRNEGMTDVPQDYVVP